MARETGLSSTALRDIAHGRTSLIRTRNEVRIMRCRPSTGGNGLLVDSTATILRVQALVALGYTQQWIASETGRNGLGLAIGSQVTRRRALAVLDLLRRVGDAPGPSPVAAVRARKRGWRIPADYDFYDEEFFYDEEWDGTIPEDAPRAPSRESIYEDYLFILRTTTDWSQSQIAERLGVTPRHLTRILSQHKEEVAA
jgi:hypothetical protein